VNGFLPNGTPIMPFEEFQKLDMVEKARYLDANRGEGPDLTIEEIVEIIKEERRNGN
jgi:hypothetical protein